MQSQAHSSGMMHSAPPPRLAGPEQVMEWLPVIVDRVARRFQPLRINLFGSYAHGEAHSHNDLDLLIVMPDALDGAARRRMAIQILSALSDLPVPKDVLVTTPDEIARRGHLVGSILRPALREGKVLYERRR